MVDAVPLYELGAGDRTRFGPKAVELGLMASWGLPVPPGFGLAFGDRTADGLDDADRAAIRKAYADLAAGRDEEPAVAVRSSAAGEDGDEFSYAGMCESYLDVLGDEAVVRAVEWCLASQGSERIDAYRDEVGVPGSNRAVIIQRMVPADFAGVCFTRTPGVGDEMVVEFVSGLADGLAAGTRTPTRVDLSRQQLAVRGVEDPSGLLDTVGEEAVREVARLALEAEQRFGHPLDVEWAAQGSSVQLVQARPITTDSRVDEIDQIRRDETDRLQNLATGQPRAWTDFSVSDMFARPATLDEEIVRALARPGGGLERSARHMGLRPATDPGHDGPFEMICGRVYLSFGGMVAGADADLPLALDTRRLPQSGDQAVDLSLAPFRPVWPGWRGLLRLPGLAIRLARAPWRLRAVRRELAPEFEQRIRPQTVEEAARLRTADLAALSDRELWETLQGHVDRIVDLIYHHQLADIVCLVLHPLLRIRLRWAYLDDADHQEMRLLTGLSGNLNTETNLDLTRVARGELDREVFLDRYGHRASPDWMISAPRWREDATQVDRMIEVVRTAERDPIAQFEHQQSVRREAEAEFSATIRKRWWMRPFHRSIMADLRDYQRYSPLRETTQDLCYRFLELARNAALEAGRRLDLGDNVFWCEFAELRSALVDGRASGLAERARARRRRGRLARSIYVPHVVRSDALDVIGRPPPVSSHAETLQGQVVATGTARGPARVVQSLDEAQDLQPGEILVTATADPAWTPLFLVAGGAVLEQGGMLSHPAIVAREYGLPAVVQVEQATRILRNGQQLTVDADRGLVLIHDE